MEIIKSLERTPRGPYTGAIGFLKPGGDCIFNVAIRTVVLDTSTNKATFCVGGGVTFDSTPELEYEECLLKADFLNTKPIFFSLFESIRLEDGNYFLLDRHLRRLEASALYFEFVFREQEIRSLLHSIAEENCEGTWKVRLELLPGGKIQIVVSELHELRLRRVALARRPVDTSDRFLFHKTTNRKFYEDELAARPDCDDIIFWNPKGEITESTIANVVVKLDGELVTPPLESGLLAGTYRDELLAIGSIRKGIVTLADLPGASEIYLINSVRKWMKASIVHDDSRAAAEHS
jgi:para-aminobenzoate synthetase/4-amino-4-deoxychorismate lyase